MVNSYFLTLVIKPTLAEGERKEILENVTKKLGKVEKQEEWGSRDLAYPIQHFTKGWYMHYHFSTESSEVPELDKSLKLNEDIIRYLLVRE